MIPRILSFIAEYAESRLAAICLIFALLFGLCAAFAPHISPIDPYDLTNIRINDARLPPGSNQLQDAPELNVKLETQDGFAQVDHREGDDVSLYLSLKPISIDQLALDVQTQNFELLGLKLRNLPAGFVVENAKKHAIRSEWTVETNTSPIVLKNIGGIPVKMSFTVQATGKATSTGMTFLLGTDGYGRDMLSAIIYGIRISIIVGAFGALGSMALGTMLGLIAAWFGGRVDALIMRCVDFQLSIPSLMVGLMILTLLGKGVDKIIIAIIIIQWTYFARTARSVALSELGKDYVEAARCLRFSALRINLIHILPNCLPPLLVLLTINIAGAITLEASLSFLGVGLPLTQPSLGMLIANGYEYMFSNMHWIAIYPGLVLLGLIVCINVVGDRLRDMLNPQLRR